jgi:two-component system, sensor histidine kinase and response regulator
MRLVKFWEWWVGSSEEFTLETRGLHAILGISIVLLLAILPINTVIGLDLVIQTILLALLGLIGVHTLSRVYKKHTVAILVYALGSYGLMTFYFFANSGSIGPTLFLFFLTFQLLIATTSEKNQWVWVWMHLAVPSFLLTFEFIMPSAIPNSYANPISRYFDLITSYLVSIVFIYFITFYLRQNLDKEKELALERAREIDKQNQELERLNHDKSKLLSIISHDLRSPLSSIQTYLEMLNRMNLDVDKRNMVQKQLLEQTRSTTAMLNNLVTWSKGQMQGMKVHAKPFNVLLTIEDIIKVHDPIAQHKGIEIKIHKNSDQKVYADPDLISIALRNLINNAIKFTSNSGSVDIYTESAKDFVVIKIVDSGVGMKKEEADKLFSGSATVTYGTNNEKGMGLGILLAKEYIEANEGTISVQSEYGKGTTFTIGIPVAHTEILQ